MARPPIMNGWSWLPLHSGTASFFDSTEHPNVTLYRYADGTWAIAHHEVWVDGIYPTAEAALAALQKELDPHDSTAERSS